MQTDMAIAFCRLFREITYISVYKIIVVQWRKSVLIVIEFLTLGSQAPSAYYLRDLYVREYKKVSTLSMIYYTDCFSVTHLL